MDQDLVEVRRLLDSLEEGPVQGGGYLAWPGDLLQEAEFKLARYAERLAEKEAEFDSNYTSAQDRYKVNLAQKKQVIREKFMMTREKFTKDEVEEEALISCQSELDAVNAFYGEYKKYRAMVASIQRYLLALTHRINELQIEKRYVQ